MKVMVDGVEIVSLSDNQKKVLSHFISSSILDADLKRRVKWVLSHKYEQSMKAFRHEWEQKLKAEGAESIPVQDEAFCALIFARPDYKDREARDAERSRLHSEGQ